MKPKLSTADAKHVPGRRSWMLWCDVTPGTKHTARSQHGRPGYRGEDGEQLTRVRNPAVWRLQDPRAVLMPAIEVLSLTTAIPSTPAVSRHPSTLSLVREATLRHFSGYCDPLASRRARQIQDYGPSARRRVSTRERWLFVLTSVVALMVMGTTASAQGNPESSAAGPRFVGYFSGNENGCPNGGAIYSTGDPPTYSFVCNGLNGNSKRFSSFEEMVTGLPCTLPNGTQRSIKLVISKTGAVSLNCGHPPRYVDNDDGTVTDVATGLIWLKNANCFGTLDYTTQALPAVAALSHGTCGLADGSKAGDWRLPIGEEFLRSTRAAAQMGCTGHSGGVTQISLTDDSGLGCLRTGSGSSFVGVSSAGYLAAEIPWEGGTIYYPLIELTFGGTATTFPYSIAGLVWPVRRAK